MRTLFLLLTLLVPLFPVASAAEAGRNTSRLVEQAAYAELPIRTNSLFELLAKAKAFCEITDAPGLAAVWQQCVLAPVQSEQLTTGRLTAVHDEDGKFGVSVHAEVKLERDSKKRATTLVKGIVDSDEQKFVNALVKRAMVHLGAQPTGFEIHVTHFVGTPLTEGNGRLVVDFLFESKTKREVKECTLRMIYASSEDEQKALGKTGISVLRSESLDGDFPDDWKGTIRVASSSTLKH